MHGPDRDGPNLVFWWCWTTCSVAVTRFAHHRSKGVTSRPPNNAHHPGAAEGHLRRIRKAWAPLKLEDSIRTLRDEPAVRQHRHTQRDRGGLLLHARVRGLSGRDAFLLPLLDAEPIRERSTQPCRRSPDQDNRWVSMMETTAADRRSDAHGASGNINVTLRTS